MRQAHANPIIAENAVHQSMAKHLDADHLRQPLFAAGCPTTPEELGHDRARLKARYAQGRQMRSRYTIFDLAAEAGCLSACVENLLTSGGY